MQHCRYRLWDFLAAPLSAALFAVSSIAPAAAIDWSGVAGKDLVLFFPGQASWEWVLTQSDHSGAKKFRGGKNCRECHTGEEATMGDLLVSGKKLEPTPIAGKPGSLPVTIKTAHDGERLYVWLQWAEGGGSAKQSDERAHVTVMIGDEALGEAPRAGCWGTCHDDAIGMASDPDGTEITKYVLGSRTQVTRQGGGESFKAAGDLEAMLGSGAFFDYFQAEMKEDGSAEGERGYILDKRHESEGGGVTAEAEINGGVWTVVLSRPLAANGTGQKVIAAGKTYAVGFAVHDSYAKHRFHHISFEHSLSLDGGDADFVAQRQ